MEPGKLLIILGPTASGKTKLAAGVANILNAGIISADSRQVFSGMNIGTGKDLKEYHINGNDIPYHLIDIRTPGEKYNVNEFKEDFYRVFKQLNEQKKLPILCGGTGMYIHSLLQHHEYTSVPVNDSLREKLQVLDIGSLRNILAGYPAILTGHADHSSFKRLIRAIEIAEYLSNHQLIKQERPLIQPIVTGLTSDVTLRRQRIISRLETRLEQGLIDEVKYLLDMGVSKEVLTFYGLEYKFVTAYLYNEITYLELKEKLAVAICQFAKRQMTFFRKMEKDGVKIHWFDANKDHNQLINAVISIYHQDNNT